MDLQLKLSEDVSLPLNSSPESSDTLAIVRKLINDLNASNTRYCHWKSNIALGKSLAGQTDIDVLIHRSDAGPFRAILGQLGFQPAVASDVEYFPSTEHYYVLDEESGVLVHLHAYFQVITGESLTKNYRFPIEEMLLSNTREVDSVKLPTKSAELVVFTLRMMLKHTSVVELAMLSRYWSDVAEEVEWLLENDPIEETLHLVECWLPSLDTELFAECIEALKAPAPLFRRITLGNQLRSQLSTYARQSTIRARLTGVRKFATMFFRRLNGSQKGMVPRNGGAVIAFVGSEATGKTTLISEMESWLGEHFSVNQIHAGKPKSTLLTFVPNIFLPALRSLFPGSRTTHIQDQQDLKEKSEKKRTSFPLIFAIRSVLLAYDRHALLSRAYGRAANGTVVLCDRYPSSISGLPDGPQLSHLTVSAEQNSFRQRLIRTEARLYREIPPPILVIFLSAPLDVTLSRNASRGKKEPEDYVRRRHARSSNLEFGKTPVYEINTDQPFDQTILEVKKAIWKVL